MIQNRKMKSTSIEGANDQAIEDAASRIHEASRPQPISVGCNQRLDFASHDTIASPHTSIVNDDSDESSAFYGDNSTRTNTSNISAFDSNFIEDEDIENSIIYLEEKKQILRKAKIHMEKEKAYTALNAQHIANGRELPFRRRGNPSIWSEAKAIMAKIAIRSDSEEGSPTEILSSGINDCEKQEGFSSQSTPATLLNRSPPSSSHPDTNAKSSSRARKRRKIDISNVKHISSAEYAKEYARNGEEIMATVDMDGCTGGTKRSSPVHHHFSATTRCQQVREMQQSMHSKNWISEAVLQQILALSHTAISKHRYSLLEKGKGQ